MNFNESEIIELKSTATEDLKKEIIAFANTKGGKLYIGVSDDGRVTGLENPDKSCLQISNMVRDSIKPDLTMFVSYETLSYDGKSVLCVDVQRGTQRPYYIAKKGLRPEGVYVRQGYSSVPATGEAIRQMIRETDGERYDELRSVNQDLTFEAANREFEQRKTEFGTAQMKTLGLINGDGIYTNLALLLSDQCRHTIKAAVFEDSDANIFKDRREITGSLFKQMHDAYDFIDFHNKTHSVFDKLLRVDTRDYPTVAVREALMNTLVHREYGVSASTIISVYPDKIELTSIGGLAAGVTMSDIMMGISVCRNARLANVFYRLALIEAYGTGIRKIIKAYEGTGKEPKLETSENAFKITLPNINASLDTLPKASIEDEQCDKILTLTEKKGTVTRKEVEDLLEIGQTTGGRLLNRLVKEGKLERKGKGRSTCYELSTI